MLGDLLDAHRAAMSIAMGIETEDEPDDLGLDGIDDDPLFGAMPASLDLLQGEAQWDAGAVIEPLPGVFLHRAQDVLRILARLVLIEKCYDLPHHDLGGIVAQLLGDRNKPDAVLGELADIHFEPESIPEETAETMDDDDIERVIVVTGPLDHFLELGPGVIHCRRAGLDVIGDHLPALTLAIGGGLKSLSGIERSTSACLVVETLR